MLMEEEIAVVNKEKLGKPKYRMISRNEFCEFLDDRFKEKVLEDGVQDFRVDVDSRGIDLKEERKMISWMDYQNLDNVIKVQVGYGHIKPLIPMIVVHGDFS
ncbi:hypothetical protein ACH5RR_023043 [Cinchona calisaya]|uniref:Uncharacterized protein n=1 Tax=Cinchona calisaya TaxID=153742 RepID=A0ABD2Z9I0_9GENT